MSIERALIARSLPHTIMAKTRAIVTDEEKKGCQPDICPEPVALEPYHETIEALKERSRSLQQVPKHYLESPPDKKDLVRLQILISPDQKFDWNRSELFLKQLQFISHRAGFELVGNEEQITIAILCSRYDASMISTVFRGQFDQCEISTLGGFPLSGASLDEWENAVLCDLYPPPPYSHLLTRPDEFKISPYESLITALSDISKDAVGFYQVLFQPVSPAHNWHLNIKTLLDLEFKNKLQADQHPQRYPQQGPSGDLRQMSLDVETKAHDDKPLFAMAMRFAVIGDSDEAENHLRCLTSIGSLFQHGGRPLEHIRETGYRMFLSTEQIRKMFLLGLTYRPGFLVNSWELTGPVHIPPAGIKENRQIKLETLKTLPLRNEELLVGNPIGICTYVGKIRAYSGQSKICCLPPEQESCHTHIIGKPIVGKTTLMENKTLYNIGKGDGVAVIDPHGDMVKDLLLHLPEDCIDRVIYFDPGDRDWVPMWNPLKKIQDQDIGRIADDLVHAFKGVVSGWGDRLECLLHNTFSALIRLPDSTLLDVMSLLRPQKEQDPKRWEEFLEILDNEAVRLFWKNDFKGYGNADFNPPKHKLWKLLGSDRTSLMLSQPESRIDFRHIMDSGMIFLADLSNVGSGVGKILGSFILSLFHLNALSRSDTPPEDRKQFHIYCDEAHWFITDAIEDLIAETRKFKVSLTIAHHYMEQFGKKKMDALSSAGSTIIFNVDARDAGYLANGLMGKVKVPDIVSLKKHEAIARIGTDVVRIESTQEPPEEPEINFRDQIIENSHRLYYKPARIIREEVRRRYDKDQVTSSHSIPESFRYDSEGPMEEFAYDEF